MTRDDAIAVAAAFANDAGYDVDQYEASAHNEEGQWEIFFRRTGESVKPRPGEFFTVFVDDDTETVRELVEGK